MPASTFDDIINQTTQNDISIYKTDDEKRLVFGWASISITVEGEQLEDRQKDMIDPEVLEEAAYEYVLHFRDTGEEHIPTMRKKGKLVESCVFTEEKQRAMGIPEGILPVGWWIGFYIEDDDAWERVKNGTYKMFSIEGKAERHPVDTVAKTFDEVLKFNPYHDAKGRFSSSNSAASFTFAPGKSKAHDLAIQREKERHQAAAGAAGGEKAPEEKAEYKEVTKDDVAAMAKKMGQDSISQEDIDQMEAHGNFQNRGGYFGTGHSFDMNKKLRADQSLDDFNDDDRKTIETLDRNMKPCPDNIKLHRTMGTSVLEQLGLDKAEALNGNDAELQKAVGKVFQSGGFTSTSYDMKENVFQGRQVKLNINAPKGTKMLVRPNGEEAEILLARNTAMHITGISTKTVTGVMGNKKQQIQVDCEVIVLD